MRSLRSAEWPDEILKRLEQTRQRYSAAQSRLIQGKSFLLRPGSSLISILQARCVGVHCMYTSKLRLKSIGGTLAK